jgi:hypothetical protein
MPDSIKLVAGAVVGVLIGATAALAVSAPATQPTPAPHTPQPAVSTSVNTSYTVWMDGYLDTLQGRR